MLRQLFSVRGLFAVFAAGFLWMGTGLPALATVGGIDRYVLQYLRAREPVELPMNPSGETRLFSPAQLSEGKVLFKQHCLNCHVGGSTLPNPLVSLSLKDLQGATPPRDTIDGLVAYMRYPMRYDGSEENYWCREVPESWLPREKVENIAAFILRAAQKAPGWGKERFEF